MRVLAHVHKYPPLHNAGAEWMLHTILRHLVDQGHDAVVLLADQELAPYELNGVTVIGKRRRLFYELARASDVLVTHLDKTQESVEVADQVGRPLVHLVHNERQLAFHWVKPEPGTLVVPNSEWLAKALRWPGAQVVCRPPVTVADYELERDPFGAEFVTLVNVTLEKGSTRFYELARAYPKRRFLAVAGAYGIQDVRRVPSNVTVLEHQPGIRDAVYAQTRVLLMPSDSETWGRVAIEGACSGIPTIAHPTEGLLEALGEAGIFADRADGTAWENALERLDDPIYYSERSDWASLRAEQLERVTDQDLVTLEAAIEELVRTNPTPRPYDAPMEILDTVRAGLRCPVCGAGSCSCTPTVEEVHGSLRSAPVSDVIEVRPGTDRGAQRLYRTALGDFMLDELDARRDGLLVAGEKPVRSVLERLGPITTPEELEDFIDRYEASSPEARQAFLDELAFVDRWRIRERLDGLVEVLAPALNPAALPAETPPPEPGDTIPTDRVGDVLAWVGDSPERAAAALDNERNGKNRPTLIAKLEDLTR